MDDRRTVLIVAVAGRALAVSARRAGYLPLVADCFGDQDTLAAAHAHVRLEAGLVRGMDEAEVLAALDELAAAHRPEGVVCGTGFEDRPQLMAAISRRWKLLGNVPHTVARLKDPETFAELCVDCGIPHPEISRDRPAVPAGWLAKRKGGAGGTHVRPALDDHCRSDWYFQRRVDGSPVSVLILADGGRAKIIGLSSQWSAPTASKPFRYGGAVRPAMLSRDTETALRGAAGRIAVAAALVGLNSVDFLVVDDEFWLLEVNPRPSATLDIFEPSDGSLFALHMAACTGALDAVSCDLSGAAAAAIVYAGRDIAAVPAFAWPAWTADRQNAGTSVKADQPLCTVLAAAATATDARALLDRRVARIIAGTHAWIS
jgi:predicted ATP-grasp superfamily ATP-dependent carboligase